MALIPNRYVYAQFPAPSDEEADWTEAMGHMVVKRGYHQNPAKPEDEVLIESAKYVQNFKGVQIHGVEDAWSINEHGQAPTMHTRTTYSNVYLPGLGARNYRKVQEDETHYWTFTPLAGNATENLAKTTRVSGYVVYDQPLDPTKATDGDTSGALASAGVTAGPVRDRIFHTGQLWSDATSKATAVPEEGHNQFTVWVPNVKTITDLVDEEWDRWILVTVTKHALRPGQVDVSEPREVKKDGIRYSLPVDLEPPKLKALSLNQGVKLEVRGGGALLPGGWLNDAITIVPEAYKIYRAVISEPDRTGDTDWQGWWEDGAEPDERNRNVIENTSVTDFSGAATTPLPPGSGHTEPHDPEPPPPEPEVYFELIATLPNAEPVEVYGRGYAEYLDLDVVGGGEYEYYATCTWGVDESSHSNHETVSYSGSESRSYRIRVRTGVEEDQANGVQADHVDMVAPDDPTLIDLPGDGSLSDSPYGAVLEFEIPTKDDVQVVAQEVGDRQFAQRQTPDLVAMDVLTPIIGLEYGITIGMPSVAWTTYSDDLVLGSQTVANEYVLVGWKREVERRADGTWGSPTTTLRMQEYPR